MGRQSKKKEKNIHILKVQFNPNTSIKKMKTITQGEEKSTEELKYLGEFQISEPKFTAAGISCPS